MYPQPPASNRPTNYYWILVGCIGILLVLVFAGLRTMAGRLNSAAAQIALSEPAPSSQPRLAVSPAAQPTPLASVAPGASVEPTPNSTSVIDVDPKALTESPAKYRSRLVRVHGTVFYTGKLADGKAWIQIVGEDNVYVDGQTSEPLPSGVVKGVQVELTGIGAGLTNVTASNGKDYDQAYVDPVQKVEIVK